MNRADAMSLEIGNRLGDECTSNPLLLPAWVDKHIQEYSMVFAIAE